MKISAETIFDTRDTPWNGLGTKIEDAPCSEEALKKAGLERSTGTDLYRKNGIDQWLQSKHQGH